MNAEPPEGSIIEVDRDIHSTTYTWKNGKKGFAQYPAAAFMLFWLCAWTVGGFMAAKTLFTNDDMPLFGRLFMLFWLGAWACGEAFVIYYLYNTFKPLMPAKLVLSPTHIEYQTGTKPINFLNYSTYHKSSKRPKFFQNFSNKIYRIETGKLDNLQLQFTGEGQRLTFDIGAKRIEIGEAISEPEREWLYEVIKNHISR